MENALPPVTNRRHFLQSVSLAGAAALVPLSGSAQKHNRGRIENRHFSVHFDVASGRLNVSGKGKTRFITNAVARALVPEKLRTIAEPDYVRTAEATKFQDALGSGTQLRVVCVDGKKQIDFTMLVTLYDDRDMVVMETVCGNVSDTDLNITAIEPLCATFDGEGCCHWPGVEKVLTNGRMYYDPGKIMDFAPDEAISSCWNAGFYRGDRMPGLAVGYLENNNSLGYVSVTNRQGRQTGSFDLTFESRYQGGFILKPGASISSDRIVFAVAETPFAALESYAQAIADAHTIRLNPDANGWCSWSYAYEGITETEMLRIAEFVARQLKPYGLEYIQVDDGFYRAFGDWEGNEKFPHGMKWLADRIRELGLKPAIWLAPYVISEGTDVHVNHPDWLIRKPNGKFLQAKPGGDKGDDDDNGGKPRRFALDISHPDAAEWLRKLFDTVANDWGYEFIKIDFVDWSLLAGEQYFDPTVTKASLYRKGAEIMRSAMGPDKHLLDCGPGQISAGFLDSMRIELDQPPVNWNQYFLKSASSAPAMAKRYYFHKRVWINDADHIVLAPLTIPQAQAAATLIAMSGGTTFSGDRLSDLDAVRLDILKKVLPAYGEAARPVDLFDHDRHELFALTVEKPFGRWTVLGVFNVDMDAHAQRTVSFERLGLDPAKQYIVYNFWEQRFQGEFKGKISLELPPASVVLLAIHEKQGVPQFLSTDRHVAQGAIELETVLWDAASGEISGVSLGTRGTDHNVFIYLPQEHEWVQDTPFFFRDFHGYTFKMMTPRILRVHVRFEESERVAWSANLKSLFPEMY